MFEALQDVVCFITTFVSFAYGTKVAWACGKKCLFSVRPENRFLALSRSLPVAIGLYSFGFLIVFGTLFSGYLENALWSAISAIILANMVVSMAMPELKPIPSTVKLIPVELNNGTTCRMAKSALDDSLAKGLVVKFKRSDGWVLIGMDRLRDIQNKTRYPGVERRQAACCSFQKLASG